jgi:hypothetical protein
MSLIARNISVRNPLAFGADTGVGGVKIEASPAITFLRVKMIFTGTRTETTTDSNPITRTETLDYTKELTLTRVPIEKNGAVLSSPVIQVSPYGYDKSSQIVTNPSDSDFRLTQTIFSNNGSPPQNMARNSVDLYWNRDFEEEVCGSWEYENTDSPELNESGDITISSFPEISFTEFIGAGYTNSATRWGAETTGFAAPSHFTGRVESLDPFYIDISEWTIGQWRAKMGINTFTIAETDFRDEGSSSVEATLEWEFS